MSRIINVVRSEIGNDEFFMHFENILNCKFIFHEGMFDWEGWHEEWIRLSTKNNNISIEYGERDTYIASDFQSVVKLWIFDNFALSIEPSRYPNIVSKDITPLLGPGIFSILCQEFNKLIQRNFNLSNIDYFAALDSHGYCLAIPMAMMHGKGVIHLKKENDLPNEDIKDVNPNLKVSTKKYSTGYNYGTIGMINLPNYKGKNVLIINDSIVTGGIIQGTNMLLRENGMNVIGAATVYLVNDIYNEMKKSREENLSNIPYTALLGSDNNRNHSNIPYTTFLDSYDINKQSNKNGEISEGSISSSNSRCSLIGIDKPIENIDFSDRPILISGFGSEGLTKSIHKFSGIDMCNITLSHFGNSETRVEINTNIRNRHVIIVSQTRTGSVNDDFMSTTMILDACERSDAGKITLVMPYYPYSRSDKKDHPRVPIGAANIARILKTYNIDNIISLDLHAGQLQGLFDKGFHNLYIINYMRDLIQERYSNLDIVLVSPDSGSIKRIEAYAEKLKKDYIILHKKRDYTKPGTVLNSMIIGDSTQYVGKTGVIIDDMADSCGTMISAINELISNGMKDVIVIVTHGVLSGKAIENINNCEHIREMIVTNSLPQENNIELCEKLYTLDSGRLITEALLAITKGESVSKLFD